MAALFRYGRNDSSIPGVMSAHRGAPCWWSHGLVSGTRSKSRQKMGVHAEFSEVTKNGLLDKESNE